VGVLEKRQGTHTETAGTKKVLVLKHDVGKTWRGAYRFVGVMVLGRGGKRNSAKIKVHRAELPKGRGALPPKANWLPNKKKDKGCPTLVVAGMELRSGKPGREKKKKQGTSSRLHSK